MSASDPRSVECPTCGAPAGNGCEWQDDGTGWASLRTRPHAARIRAAESAEAERAEQDALAGAAEAERQAAAEDYDRFKAEREALYGDYGPEGE